MFAASCIGTAILTAGATIEQDARLRNLLAPAALQDAMRRGLQESNSLLTSAGTPTAMCADTINVYSHRVLYESLSDPSGDANANGYYRAPKAGRLAVVLRTADGATCRYGSAQATLTPALQKLMHSVGQDAGQRLVEVADGWASAAAVTLDGPGAPVLVVGVHVLSPWHKLLHPGWVGLRFALLLLCLNALSAFLLLRILVGRIKRADRAATAWTSGTLNVRINDVGHDELSRLSKKFDAMADAMSGVIEIKQALASAEERNRMARDLHDSAKQRAFALNLQLSVAQGIIPPASPAARLVDAALTLSGQLQMDLAAIIRRFGESTIVEAGLLQALADSIGPMLDSGAIAWQIALDEQTERSLDANFLVSYQLFLISMEAVANVLKHSRATRCDIIGACHEQLCSWRIIDNGMGYASGPISSGMGLENIKLRAASLAGGTFDIAPGDNAGTVITITFRLQELP